MKVYYRCPVHGHNLEKAYCPRCPLKYAMHEHDYMELRDIYGTRQCRKCKLQELACEDKEWENMKFYRLPLVVS